MSDKQIALPSLQLLNAGFDKGKGLRAFLNRAIRNHNIGEINKIEAEYKRRGMLTPAPEFWQAKRLKEERKK